MVFACASRRCVASPLGDSFLWAVGWTHLRGDASPRGRPARVHPALASDKTVRVLGPVPQSRRRRAPVTPAGAPPGKVVRRPFRVSLSLHALLLVLLEMCPPAPGGRGMKPVVCRGSGRYPCDSRTPAPMQGVEVSRAAVLRPAVRCCRCAQAENPAVTHWAPGSGCAGERERTGVTVFRWSS